MAALGWLLLGVVGIAAVPRIVSLIRPHPFPAWMQPLLGARLVVPGARPA